ncbi:hypothetical protein BGW36DRAFT_388390 [Talaromyces proteolyticus]|uniref:Uncharacterized protein n=1 Tax=Talaromyces proteolyticus TaxID=1131652 RepID=A0AAD4KHU4_9EURO|nr:uncharacterized protein BGW36DRAFT_388390 [Talaromyces proteolyticus]KAH8691474.1 hypothetical protein BGW36DRAFT_388390 [Talaromyces proteolyticus]
MIYFRLLRLMTRWPTLVREYSMLREGGGDVVFNHLSVSKKAYAVLDELKYINDDWEHVIDDQDLLRSAPSYRPNDPLPLMFEVKDTMAALAICHYAMFSIIVCRILLSLQIMSCETGETVQLQAGIVNQCHRIWMLIDHSLCHKPLGLPVMQGALILTFETAVDDDLNMKRYILDALNELDAYRVLAKGPWKENQVVYIARSLRGECPFG